MKKTIILLAILVGILSLNQEEKISIPKDSIRFRVIASSNQEKDQLLKKKIVKNLRKELKQANELENIEDARNYVKEKLPVFTSNIENTIKKENSNQTFQINYGNHYFPEKTYNDVVYEEGVYESVVVTLGEGRGKNFWCVLFPPLCFKDLEKVEYKSFIKEIIDKYF